MIGRLGGQAGDVGMDFGRTGEVAAARVRRAGHGSQVVFVRVGPIFERAAGYIAAAVEVDQSVEAATRRGRHGVGLFGDRGLLWAGSVDVDDSIDAIGYVHISLRVDCEPDDMRVAIQFAIGIFALEPEPAAWGPFAVDGPDEFALWRELVDDAAGLVRGQHVSVGGIDRHFRDPGIRAEAVRAGRVFELRHARAFFGDSLDEDSRGGELIQLPVVRVRDPDVSFRPNGDAGHVGVEVRIGERCERRPGYRVAADI